MEKEYRLDSWKGVAIYRCEHCYFDCETLEEMKSHIEKTHRETKPRKPMAVTIYDRFGNPIKER